jgi:hypothetical protein
MAEDILKTDSLTFEEVIKYKDLYDECRWLNDNITNGGALHIVCEDGNYEDGHLDYCINYIESGEYENNYEYACHADRQLKLAKDLRAIPEEHREMVNSGCTITEKLFDRIYEQDDHVINIEMALKEVCALFDQADREGADKDVPEGVRYINVSDTLANQISSKLKELLNG